MQVVQVRQAPGAGGGCCGCAGGGRGRGRALRGGRKLRGGKLRAGRRARGGRRRCVAGSGGGPGRPATRQRSRRLRGWCAGSAGGAQGGARRGQGAHLLPGLLWGRRNAVARCRPDVEAAGLDSAGAGCGESEWRQRWSRQHLRHPHRLLRPSPRLPTRSSGSSRLFRHYQDPSRPASAALASRPGPHLVSGPARPVPLPSEAW